RAEMLDEEVDEDANLGGQMLARRIDGVDRPCRRHGAVLQHRNETALPQGLGDAEIGGVAQAYAIEQQPEQCVAAVGPEIAAYGNPFDAAVRPVEGPVVQA